MYTYSYTYTKLRVQDRSIAAFMRESDPTINLISSLQTIHNYMSDTLVTVECDCKSMKTLHVHMSTKFYSNICIYNFIYNINC